MTDWATVFISEDDHWKTRCLRGKVAKSNENSTVIHVNSPDFDSVKVSEDSAVLKDGEVLDYTVEKLIKYPCEDTVHVYGHSDDLIELTGCVVYEFYADVGESTQIRIEDTEIEAFYNMDGEWEFKVLNAPDANHCRVEEVGSELATKFSDYTEVVQLSYNQQPNSVEKL